MPVTLSQASTIIIGAVMTIQLVLLLYGGFVFCSKLSSVVGDVEKIKMDAATFSVFAELTKVSSERNAQAITDILVVVQAIPNLQQRMLTTEIYMAENGSLRSDINVIGERTSSLVSTLDAINRQICTINERQWESLEREKRG